MSSEIISEVIAGKMARQAPRRLVVDGLIDRGPEIDEGARRLRGLHHSLGQQNGGVLLAWVEVPRGAIAAVPAETARRGIDIVAPAEHREAHAPAPDIAEKQL